MLRILSGNRIASTFCEASTPSASLSNTNSVFVLHVYLCKPFGKLAELTGPGEGMALAYIDKVKEIPDIRTERGKSMSENVNIGAALCSDQEPLRAARVALELAQFSPACVNEGPILPNDVQTSVRSALGKEPKNAVWVKKVDNIPEI